MENEAQTVNADGTAVTVPVVTPPAATQEPTVEELKSALEGEKILREIAESDATNAKKDIIALKTGKKRAEIDPSQIAPNPVVPNENRPIPAVQPQPDLAAELAEQKRINAEILRGLAARNTFLPSGGSGNAESPSPKPKGYWSDAQKAELRKRGWNDVRIAKAEALAQRGGATGERTSLDAGFAKRTY